MLLYKYSPFNINTLNSLANQGLWCHNPIVMNDPMEGLIHRQRNFSPDTIKQVMEYAKTSGHNFFKWINTGMVDVNQVMHQLRKLQYDKFTLCALSETSNNGLMWSHYSDQHKGIVLGIEFDLDYSFVKVQYVNDKEELPDFDLLRWCRLFDKTEVNDEAMLRMMIQDITFKSDIWSYEREWRVWQEGVGYYKYEAQQLKRICIGLRFDKKNYGELLIKFMNDYPHLEIEEMKHDHFM